METISKILKFTKIVLFILIDLMIIYSIYYIIHDKIHLDSLD